VGGGVQLGPLGTAATHWPIVACPGWLWWWRIWWNEDWQEKPKYSEKTRPSATLSSTNPTWPDAGSNPGRRGGKPATNRLSYGAALLGISMRSFITAEVAKNQYWSNLRTHYLKLLYFHHTWAKVTFLITSAPQNTSAQSCVAGFRVSSIKTTVPFPTG
jgi:hypothetical protein